MKSTVTVITMVMVTTRTATVLGITTRHGTELHRLHLHLLLQQNNLIYFCKKKPALVAGFFSSDENYWSIMTFHFLNI
jgi:hypothetical protein